MFVNSIEAEREHSDRPVDSQPWMPLAAPSSGLADANLMMLPYVEFSRAMLRAHHNFHAMMEANRTLADALRDIVRRQQDLALEIAEQAWSGSSAGESEAPANDREAVFKRAAEAVREIGEAVIEAQIEAIATLQGKTAENAEEGGSGAAAGARRRAGVRR